MGSPRALLFTGVVLVVGCVPGAPSDTSPPTTNLAPIGGGGGSDAAASALAASTTAGAGGAGGGEGGAGGAPGCVSARDCVIGGAPCLEGDCIEGACVALPANDFAACDDGTPCTQGDFCDDGACTPGIEIHCSATDPCHVGACDAATGACVDLPGNDGAQCDDQNACTYTGFCVSGVCHTGLPIDCTAFDTGCTVGQCMGDGQCYAAPISEGLSCDDTSYCTVHDRCASGACVGDPNTCIQPTDVCKLAGCAEPGGPPVPCDDGNDCSSGETCDDGVCENGVAANDGAPCNDYDGCTFGTTCSNEKCLNATQVITACIDGDGCCPLVGCDADTDCAYYPGGVKENLPIAKLALWSQCYVGSYGASGVPLATVLGQCDKARLLIGCRPAGADTLTLAAMALRDDVLFDCGSQPGCVHQAHSVGWYYSPDYSWGFAQGKAAVDRVPCDTDPAAELCPQQRMCWLTTADTLGPGYRCGEAIVSDASWEMIIFHTD